MKITMQWLKEKSACHDGLLWFEQQEDSQPIDVLTELIEQNKLDWANWLREIKQRSTEQNAEGQVSTRSGDNLDADVGG